ncbi:YifB family Mg chelatase-like AAA ATPase [Alkaliphilus sp. MSJ-5]|uniref:YifB family Mg chelatase-like AAA ATPase n=1 Tax=Alkaliphilus flagellatus TaxID=2841507 RepID=A0ABS6G5F7_9FIRM|nr:YifB family Mg chelatase-like AAA ATPase [Alkaliphilus flagellatus]MBU5677404.1 YifB family Mg chelatase-like AAA ATPase [Alkaliphilus flagellatus]
MLAKVKTCCITGLIVTMIEVEVDIANGLPNVNVVGLPDTSIKESKERVRAAIKNSELDFPLKRITINLSPADTKKEGSHFDLPIALGILGASMQIPLDELDHTLVLGELSLDGKINKVSGVLPMLLQMYREGIKRVIVPNGNLEEAKIVDDIEIIAAKNLNDIALHLKQEDRIYSCKGSSDYEYKTEIVTEDFKDLQGQENFKRGLEIAASGNHNLLMIGPPGSGKTMAARRLPSILPKLTFHEALEITKIYSVAGLLNSDEGLVSDRPFRSPHHTSSLVALTGGGRIPKPGEVSLSHYGVLFLDELPEFNKSTLEVLRQPLEDRTIHISRINGSYTYPADFMLLAAMNPCPCGYYGTNSGQECSCTPYQINRYVGKISGPLMDRIDIIVETSAVDYNDLISDKNVESSKDIRFRVEKAREIQLERYKKTKYLFNSQLNGASIKKYCSLTPSSERLMNLAFDKMKLSARGYSRILKVARTIADLGDSDVICEDHLAEALQYRNLNGLIFK